MEYSVCLHEILADITCSHIGGRPAAEVSVSSVSADSRTVEPGGLFVAMAGGKVDGHDYISQALDRGCAALVVEKGHCDAAQIDPGVCCIAVESTWAIFGEICSAFYGHPSRQLHLIGITGTNGKTTCTYLLEKILSEQGHRVGVIGTVEYRYTNRDGELCRFDAPFTTPEPALLQKLLRRMADAGVDTVVMEVSSHALAQERLGQMKFDLAAFTNLSHDHLDYHRGYDEYFAAKSLLFSRHLKPGGKAVVTCRTGQEGRMDPWSARLISLLADLKIPFLSAGEVEGCDLQVTEVKGDLGQTTISFAVDGRSLQLTTPMVGRFNVDNIMTVVGLGLSMGAEMQQMIAGLSEAHGAPGRLQRIALEGLAHDCPAIFVDYAHTPDALTNVLIALKTVPHRRLICVFGCGGDRDNSKRPEMGEIAARLADSVIVTDDNPRSEEPDAIREQILAGVMTQNIPLRDERWLLERGEGAGCVVIGDRNRAIERAVWSAGSRDIVLVAGKGHEAYQLTKSGKRFFDDSLAVREALTGWSVQAVAEALGITGGNLKERYFTGISTDSRTVSQGELFVALQGENFDGHDYLDKALCNGAAGVVVSQQVTAKIAEKMIVFTVPDTLSALGALAGYRRRLLGRLGVPVVVAVTGSCGKTTVKEMTAAIFEKQWPDSVKYPVGRVLKTQGNFNNLIGLPLSLLPLSLRHRAVILEMGMNHPGEIARLAQIADPDISCIVNVRGAHLEGLGSLENVARAKEELFENSRADCRLIINLDDPFIRPMAEKYKQKLVFCSQQPGDYTSDQVRGCDVKVASGGNISFTLQIAEEKARVHLQVPGRHNVANALAAAAMGHAAGIDLETIACGLAEFTATDKRLVILEPEGGPKILDDTYNANPASMEAGLDTLVSMGGDRSIAILGDMFELGEAGIDAHVELGRQVARRNIDCLLVVGSFAEYTMQGARAGGMSEGQVEALADKAEVAGRIRQLFADGQITGKSWILVKASRGMRLETVVGNIVNDGPWGRIP